MSINNEREELARIEEFWISKNNPAVTSVDEWTKEEIGVGAAIAAGSQGENGNKADLVDKARNKRGRRKVFINVESSIKWVFIDDIDSSKIKITRRQSPSRFIRMVMVAEDVDVGDW